MGVLIFDRHFTIRQLAKAASVLAQAGSILSVRAIRKGPVAAFQFSARAREAYDELVGGDPIPEINLSELRGGGLVPQRVWLDLSQPPATMTAGELAHLCALVKLWNPRTVVEVGTERGFTTLHLSRNTGEDSQIFTVDLPPELATDAPFYSDPHLVRGSATVQRVYGDDPKITQVLQDSTTVQWERLLTNPIDLAFIDASHLYEHVRKDTEGILRALSPDGLVIWHDYRTVEIRRGVRRYLTELYRSGLPVRRIAGTTFCVYARAPEAGSALAETSLRKARGGAGRC